MSINLVKSITLNIKNHTLAITFCPSNVSPREYETVETRCDSVTDLKNEVARLIASIRAGNTVILPSCTSKFNFVYQSVMFDLYLKDNLNEDVSKVAETVLSRFDNIAKYDNAFYVTAVNFDNDVILGEVKQLLRNTSFKYSAAVIPSLGELGTAQKYEPLQLNQLKALITANTAVQHHLKNVRIHALN